jgi:hypothetical protein
MSPRNKSLLEAFQASGPTAPGASSAPSPTPAPLATPRLASSGGANPRGVQLRASQLQILVLVQLILLVAAFWLGRASAGEVQASRDGEPDFASQGAGEAPAEPAPQEPAPRVDPNPRTATEQALLDPRNVYTIKVVEYANTDSNRKLAQDALRYLVDDQRLPACLAGTGTRLYILVGAAPTHV